ncbi:hypothetical protein VSR68_20165 [Paraburkholderia phymatum]|uniref:hypothetical protein n=1 Tax=Paraburkholderia phymatum TaxID=148447 RepID=UPI003182AA88
MLTQLMAAFLAWCSWPDAIRALFQARIARRATTADKSESLPRGAHFRKNRFYFAQPLRTRPAPADIQPVDHH